MCQENAIRTEESICANRLTAVSGIYMPGCLLVFFFFNIHMHLT